MELILGPRKAALVMRNWRSEFRIEKYEKIKILFVFRKGGKSLKNQREKIALILKMLKTLHNIIADYSF